MTTDIEPRSFSHLPTLSADSEELRWFLMPNEAQEYLMGRTTPLTSYTFHPKSYARRFSKSENSSPEPDHQRSGVTGPHRGRLLKVSPSSPSSPPPALSSSVKRSHDFSKHRGSFMAEVFPLESERDEGSSLQRMLSIRLHVAEEFPSVVEAGEVMTNFKRWVSTDALSVRSNNTTQSSVNGSLPGSAKNPTVPNGIPHSNSKCKNKNIKKKREGKVDVHSADVSENGSIVISKEATKKHVKKRWRIKRIFGISRN